MVIQLTKYAAGPKKLVPRIVAADAPQLPAAVRGLVAKLTRSIECQAASEAGSPGGREPLASGSSGLDEAQFTLDQCHRPPAILKGAVKRGGCQPDHVGLAPVAGQAARQHAVEEGAAVAARATQAHRELRTARLGIARRQDLDALADAHLEQALEPAGEPPGSLAQ